MRCENVPGEDGRVVGRSYRSQNHHRRGVGRGLELSLTPTSDFALILQTSQEYPFPTPLTTYRDDDRDMVG